MRAISNAVAGGGGLADAFDAAGSYFPSLMRELLRVGEQSGHLDEVFRHLADHYEYQDKLRREFLASISWPMAQLGMALTLVGLVILVSGLIGGKDLAGRDMDILGFGLRGMPGMITYFMILGCVAAAFFALFMAARRGAFWARPIQRAAWPALPVPRSARPLSVASLAH